MADESGEDSGAAYVFTRSGGVWTEQQKLVPQDGATDSFFGSSVSISGDMALVGAYDSSNNGIISGSVYAFTRAGGVWSEAQKLVPTDRVDYTRFGVDLSINGDNLLVGAYNRDSPTTSHGSAYLFGRDPVSGEWAEQQKLTASDGADYDNYGWSVSLDGNRVLIGAPNNNGNGSAYVYSAVSACAGLIENCAFEIEVPSNGTGGGWTSTNIGPFTGQSDGWVSANCPEGSCFSLNSSPSPDDPTIGQTVTGLTAGTISKLTGDYAVYNFGYTCSINGSGQFAIDIDGINLEKLDNPGCSTSEITWGSFETSFVAQNTDVTISFRAEVDGSDTDYAIDNIALVEIQGPDITVSPTSRDFSSVTVGTSSDLEISVSNDGSAVLTLGDVAVADPIEAPFSILANSSCLLDPLLSPLESCSYTVHFAPDSVGPVNSTFDIISDDPDEGSITISVTGEGSVAAVPNISIAPTTEDFGSVTVGTISDEEITVTNDGDATLTLGAVAVTDPIEAPYSILGSSTCPGGGSLAPTESCSYTIRFAPDGVGVASSTFDIASDDPDEGSLTVSVSGEGTAALVPDIHVDPTSIDFPDTTVGVVLDSQTVTISNNGVFDLSISSIELSGLDAAQFTLETASGASPCGGSITLAPAEDGTVSVAFEPDETGAASATLEIASNDPDSAEINVPLVGTGLDSGVNNPTSKPRLISPTNGQSIKLGLSRARVLRWHPSTDPDGDEVTYDVYLCTDPNPLDDCYEATIAASGFPVTGDTLHASIAPLIDSDSPGKTNAAFAVLLLGLTLVGLVWKARRRMLMWLLLFITGLFVASCSDNKGGITYQVTDLSPGTSYYWGVVAKDGQGGETESDVWNFTTK